MTGQLRFDDRVAIVTGGGRGIGRAHALMLAERGARVVVADLGCDIDGRGSSPQPATAVAHEIIADGGEAVACHADVASEEDASSIVSTAVDTFGRLDIVINNAGIFFPAPFEQLSVEQFRAMFDAHFFGTLLVTRAAWPHLVSSRAGRIVNTTSEAMLGMELLSSYGAAKGAIFGLTRTLAVEGAPHSITANCIAPRAGTRMGDAHAVAMSVPPEFLEQAKKTMPPEINTAVSCYLAHQSCSLNGEVLHVTPERVSRLAVIRTKGISQDGLSPEKLALAIGDVTDPTDAEVTDLSRLV